MNVAYRVDHSVSPLTRPGPIGALATTGRYAGRILRTGALLSLSSLLPSCSLDTTEPVPEVIWVAATFPAFPSEDTLEDPWEGSAEIRSGTGQTRITLQVRDAEPGFTFRWAVRSGSCTTSGIPVASDPSVFETLEINEFGEAAATLVLIGNLATSQNYAVEMFDADDPSAPPFGCGNLLRTD